ncbi:MAG: tryptophan synthase subunit alpha [Bacteroidales bacterium]|nr:tryptophan synthase subunit alpha [Bacteroidales bacterium]
MNRITKLFKSDKKDKLSVFFTAGYPVKNSVKEIIVSLEKHGVDMIEIGIPFSDPMADGKTIQDSSTMALKNGMSLDEIFSQIKDVRKDCSIPLVFMGYLNPIMHFGFERFCEKCKEVGVDGLIIPDLPFKEYIEHYKDIILKNELKFTMLITPETSKERIMEIDKATDGFIYMVSTASTTGAKDDFDSDVVEYFKRVKQMNLNNPRMIGFGISNNKLYSLANKYADGAIVGSLFVKLLGENNSIDEAVEKLVKKLKN